MPASHSIPAYISSVFSLKTTILTFSGSFNGEETPLNHSTGLRHTNKSSSCLKATFKDLIPPPTGVVNGPFIPIKYSLKVFIVFSGSHCPV